MNYAYIITIIHAKTSANIMPDSQKGGFQVIFYTLG